MVAWNEFNQRQATDSTNGTDSTAFRGIRDIRGYGFFNHYLKGGEMMSTINRVNGLVSGFDTETLVKDLMKMEKTKSDKVFRDKQSVSWQKDAYKEMMSLLRGYQSDFLDVLKPNSNMRSAAAFNVFSAGAKISGTDTTKVAVSASSTSLQGSITINSISTLATKDTWSSSSEVKSLKGTALDAASIDAINAGLVAGNNSITITLDGTTKTIELAGGTDTDPVGGYVDMAELVTDLNAQMLASFGAGRIVASDDGGALKLSTTGHTVVMGEGETGVLASLGFAAGASNTLSLSSTLASAFGVDDNGLEFSINGITSTTMGITSADTIQSMIQKVNASTAGVTLGYSSLTNGFSMKANKEGIVNNISLTDTDGFFANSLKLSTASGRVQGVDAEFTIDGVSTTRSENSVIIDGTTIQFKETSAVAIDVTISPNTTSVKDNIVNFVNRYNELIEKVQGKLNETKYRDFTPLTDEEKESMSEDNIKLWEDKAKSGMLKGEGLLAGLMTKLRKAFSETVADAGINLKDIGISTSTSYKDNGKLVIDEGKLDSAIATKSSEITLLFTTESSYQYGDATNITTRYAENGLAARVNDILNDSIRIARDENGKRGYLVEKAGYEQSNSDTSSNLAKKITALEARYALLIDKMNDTEDRYYAKFTAMESALSRMNSQSTNLSNMLGTSS